MGELEEKDTQPPSDTKTTTESHDSEEPKETDKMLDNKKVEELPTTEIGGGIPAKTDDNKIIPLTKTSTPEKKKDAIVKAVVNGDEVIINIPDAEMKENSENNGGGVAVDGKKLKITKEDREVKPKRIPIGGIKIPGFFTKIKPPRAEGDGADGELLQKETDDNKANEEKPKVDEKRPSIGDRIRNFFTRKPETPPKTDDGNSVTTTKPNESVTTAENDETTVPPQQSQAAVPQKRGLLNAIRLPIANLIPKRKTDDDVEMGTGPGTKAGLASMETLDDSLKDQDTVDKALVSTNNDADVEKLKGSQDINATENKNIEDDKFEERIPILDRIRGYKCSIDDALIVFGILIFVLLLGVIGYVLSNETLIEAPLREGRFVDAVTSCGMVEGHVEDKAFAFRGIPYAVPPIGMNRFKPAQTIGNIHECWNGTLKAHNSTELCSQILGNGTNIGVEDCLYLDIVTPHVRYENPMPVVILIGAESLTGGSPGILQPSAKMAHTKDIVFVRPNFRMGPFGFLALDALSKSTHPPTSGNYALSDIIAVLQWVNLNIGHFGGDKNSITLFGHRAGGTLVSALVTSSSVKNLYHRAWVSSSAAMLPGKPLDESERLNQEYMTLIQCKDVDCLRDASVEEILNAVPDTWRQYPIDLPSANENSSEIHEWLVLDGDIMRTHPADVWKSEVANTKFVIGTTAHQSHNKKLNLKYINWTAEEIRGYVDDSKIGKENLTDEVIALYNATTYQGLVAMISDIRTVCPLLTLARQQPSTPFYVVTQIKNETNLADVDSDIEAILGIYDEPQTNEQKEYIKTMQNLFYKYVATGEIKQYEPRRPVLIIGQEAISSEDYSHCNFWISKDIVPRHQRID